MQNVRKWLASIGMSEHADLFAANRIDSCRPPRFDRSRSGKSWASFLATGARFFEPSATGEAIESPRSPAMTESPLHKSAERRQLWR